MQEVDISGHAGDDHSQSKAFSVRALWFGKATSAARKLALLFGRNIVAVQQASPDDGVHVSGFLRVPQIVCRQECCRECSGRLQFYPEARFAHCNGEIMW